MATSRSILFAAQGAAGAGRKSSLLYLLTPVPPAITTQATGQWLPTGSLRGRSILEPRLHDCVHVVNFLRSGVCTCAKIPFLKLVDNFYPSSARWYMSCVKMFSKNQGFWDQFMNQLMNHFMILFHLDSSNIWAVTAGPAMVPHRKRTLFVRGQVVIRQIALQGSNRLHQRVITSESESTVKLNSMVNQDG